MPPSLYKPTLAYPFVDDQSGQSLGGANPKTVFTDSAGQRWLFKPQPLNLTTVDVVASAVAEMAGVPSPIVHAGDFFWKGQRRQGSLQPLLPAKAYELSRSLRELSDEQRESLQRHQVLDWLLGNIDTHRKQFLVLHDGTVVGVDKSQSLRLFPLDTLTWDTSHRPLNLAKSVYSYLLQGAREGRYALRPEAALDFAAQTRSQIPQGWLREVWRPVIAEWPETRFALARLRTGSFPRRNGYTTEDIEKMLDLIEKRKHNLVKRFEALYYDRSGSLWKRPSL